MLSLNSIRSKKAQLTIFIIIAIVIVALVLLIFVFRKVPSLNIVSTNEAENAFRDCVSIETQNTLKTMSLQGGWVHQPTFEPGSDYMPFSNYFHFLGIQIPYWFYISGNNIQKIQMPTKEDMENQLSRELEQKIISCKPDLPNYNITFQGNPKINSTIRNTLIQIKINWPMQIQKQGSDSISLKESQNIKIKSNFGSLYLDALRIFSTENSTLFLENYSLDVINLYAPTTRIEFSCAPKTWKKQEVETDVKDALASNIPMIKFKGNYYSIKNKEEKYFIVNVPVNNQINLLYSTDWPTRFDVWPSENDVLIANPVGTQQGLGFLGFCYVAYHFVYDLSFPVLIQVSNGNEILQFPVIVSIDKNQPRQANNSEESPLITQDVCNPKTQDVTISTYDQNSNPVEAEIYYGCFEQSCYIGKTEISKGLSQINTKLPVCLNGILTAKNPDYEDYFEIISSNEPFSANIFMNKLYEKELQIDLQPDEKAMITFDSGLNKKTIFYPEQKTVELSAQEYNVTAMLFKTTDIKISSQTGEKCVTIPGAFSSIFNQNQCFDITTPEQTLTDVVFGGGLGIIYFSEDDLLSKNTLTIVPEKFEIPTTIEAIANIYSLLETAELKIDLK